MIPSFMDLQIAKSAMQLAQTQIDITGNNINNASDPNYSRQVGLSQAEPDFTVLASGQLQSIGQGADISEISRSRDQFLDTRYRQLNSQLSSSQLTDNELQQIAGLFNEPGSNGLQTAMTNFFNSWQDLAKDPTNPASQSVVIQQGLTFSDALNTISSQLATLNGNYQSEVAIDIQTVNTTTTQIAQLTSQIQQSEAQGANSNDLLDQRDALLDKLSSYGDINVTQTPDTANPAIVHLSVTFAGTQVVNDGTATAIGSTVTPASGSIKALNDLQNYTQNVSSQLDSLTGTIINDVNSLSSGFFTGTTAANITVNPTIVNGSTGINVAPDGSNALAVSNLMSNNGYDQTYSALIAKIGGDNSTAHQNSLLYQGLVNQISQARTSVSGVNINDEMANMVQYQQAYSAAARLMEAIDQMYTTLLGIQ